MDVKKKTIQTYDEIAEDYARRNSVHFWTEELAYFKQIIPGRRVIDLGCGAGRSAEEFVEKGFVYIGIDASEKMLDLARKRVLTGKFFKEDFTKTHFSEDSFDGFWAAASFLHVKKKEINKVLEEARRITKNSGVGFISLKKKTVLSEGLINKAGKLSSFGGRYFSFYTKNEFKNILLSSGFEILKAGNHIENDPQKTNWLVFFVKVIK